MAGNGLSVRLPLGRRACMGTVWVQNCGRNKYIISFDVLSKTGSFPGYHVTLGSGTGTEPPQSSTLLLAGMPWCLPPPQQGRRLYGSGLGL